MNARLCWLAALTVLAHASPSAAKGRTAPDYFPAKALYDCNDFISQDDIRALFDDIARDFEGTAETFSIGTSLEGREMHALKLSPDLTFEAVLPEVRIIGGIHGNECMGVQMVADIAVWLTAEYGANPFATRLLDEVEVVLVPSVNPDGYVGERATRENANGVDLNRNLHFAWVNAGEAPFSEPETRAIRNLSDTQNFTLGLSYHTEAPYVNAPWNYTPHHPPDEALFQAMGEAYAGSSSYNVVFGWDWFDIQGDVNDWSLGVKGTFDWTLELMSDLDPQWDIHSAGVAGFLSFIFQRAEGVVTDGNTGEPLAARIEIEPEGVPVFTDPERGDYHRVLLPGVYDITAVADGYISETQTGVIVESDAVTAVDFALEPIDGPHPTFGFSVNGMTLPQTVSHSTYITTPYLNRTVVWDALGPPDGEVYAMSPTGTVTIDMGPDSPVVDEDGPDLQIVSGDQGEDDPVTVQVAEAQDGPFVTVASGRGTFDVDIADSGFDSIRFVRLIDTGDDPFNVELAGYDLDAVINLSKGPFDGVDGGVTPDAPDGGAIEETAADASDDAWRASAGDCGCRITGYRPTDWMARLRALLNWSGLNGDSN